MHIDPNNLFDRAGLTDARIQSHDFKQQPVIATIEVDIGDQEPKAISVREYQDPYLLAVEFCNKHGLNHKAVEVIEAKIEDTVKRHKRAYTTNITESPPLVQSKEPRMSPSPARSSSYSNIPKNSRNNTKKQDPNDNLGNRLYQKGLKIIQRVEQFRVKRHIEQEQQLGKQLTFKPKINTISQKIIQMRRQVGGSKHHHSKKRSPIKPALDELESCTFKPEINKVSEMIVKSKQVEREEDRIQMLYYDSVKQAEKKKQALEKEKHQYTYKPKLNERSRSQIKEGFLKRLETTIARKKNKQLTVQKTDKECTFEPKVGRAPKVQRNKQNLPIGDYLMSVSSSKPYIRQSTTSTSLNRSQTTATTSTLRHSQNLYSNLINQRISQLFSMLDSDQDGLISPDSIDIQYLSANTLLFLQPLFTQIEQVDATLDELMFKKAMLKLIEGADAAARGRFLSQKWSRFGADEDQFAFAPEINQKSRKILNEKGDRRASLYEQGLKNKQKLEAKIESEKAKKQEKELEECSFKPALNVTSQIYIKKAIQQKIKPNNISK